MTNSKSKSSIDIAASALRAISLATPPGALLGSEDELLSRAGVSRVTIRQAARVLEGEGLVRVRRGINGGYFAARPSVEMVEGMVCAYLDTLGLEPHHVGVVATALWVQVLREAALADRGQAQRLAERLIQEVEALGQDTTIEDIGRIERECRSAIFELIDGAYIEVLFRINAAFSRQRISVEGHLNEQHEGFPQFFRDWKKAKVLELEAIADGDDILAVMAALHSRKLWGGRTARRELLLHPETHEPAGTA